MGEVLCLGNFVVDVIGRPIDVLPPRGGLRLLDTLELHPGGNGPNCAAALARLGVAARVAGRVGDDLAGRLLRAELAAAGVATDGVVVDSRRPTGMTLVAVDGSGERSFLHHSGANAAFGPGDVDLDRAAGARFLHAGSHFVLPAMDGEPLAGVLREARRRGLATTLDVCWDAAGRWMERLAVCLPEADWFMPSEAEAAALSGEHDPARMAACFHGAGARGVVIKLGAQGSFASRDGVEARVAAFPVRVVDATGAGDCFAAGFLAAQLAGRDLGRSLRFANACGALAVGAVGATAGMRPRAEVEAWMAGFPEAAVGEG